LLYVCLYVMHAHACSHVREEAFFVPAGKDTAPAHRQDDARIIRVHSYGRCFVLSGSPC